MFGKIAGWLVGGGTSAIATGAERIGGIFAPNAEAESVREHESDMAALGQFATEFRSHMGQTKWDSFCDGLNRLPRPLITLSVMGLFILAPLDPTLFLMVAQAYAAMPDGFWALLSVVIAFYFGGRMQLTKQSMAVQGDALKVAKQLTTERKEFHKLLADDDDGLPDIVPGANRIIAKWKQIAK